MPYALAAGDVAGAVVTIVKDGKVLVAKGYGYADVKKRTPVDPQTTLFRQASVSKLFTATAVMQLVEAGRLDLDKDVNSYLDFRIPERDDGPITLRHLLTHTPGFEETLKGSMLNDPAQLPPLRQFVRQRVPTRIFKAGSTPAYSNYGAALAGYIVELVSGQPFEDYIEQHIFQPLGMRYSTFRQPLPKPLAPYMAQGYRQASGEARPFEVVGRAPPGALSASGMDMARFMLAHLNRGELDGRRILAAETADRMHDTPTDMIPPLNRMLLGFFEQDYNGHRVISHGGDLMNMHGFLNLMPDDGVGFVLSMNSLGKAGASNVIRDEFFTRFLDRYFPSTATQLPTTTTAKAHAQQVAGLYQGSRRPDRSFLAILGPLFPMKVIANGDDTISLVGLNTSSGDAALRFREIAPYVWQDTASGWRIAAQMDGGRVVRLSHDQLSPFTVYEPHPAFRSPAWLRPAFILAFAATLLTALFWPIAALLRRRLGVPLALPPPAARARKRLRYGSLLTAGMTATWLLIIVKALSDFTLLTVTLPKWLYVLYGLSVIAYVGGAVLLLLGAVETFRAGRPWRSRLWAVVLGLSGPVLLYFAWVTNLMSFQMRY